MIAVYAICHVKAEKTAQFEALVKDLITASLKDKGNVSYACGPVQGQPHVYTFIEQWQSPADLEVHTQQAHFLDAVAQFDELLSKEIEINVVELL